MMTDSQRLGDCLINLGKAVRRQLTAGRDVSLGSSVVGHQSGDTVYAIDREVEPVIINAIESWPEYLKPLLLIAEGFGNDGRHKFGSVDTALRYRLLVDPIDGTRSLMYDKRSAWFLASIAADMGDATHLTQSLAAVMLELPTSKQHSADTYLFVAPGVVTARRTLLDTGESSDLAFSRSRATSLLHGFGQVSNFFPGTKQMASELMERIVESTLGCVQPGQASVFDDQYISTGGQLVELIAGHDRFCCDLRPLFHDVLEHQSGTTLPRGLECHPYDMAGLMIAKAAGVVLTDGFGHSLDAAFNILDPVHWCGYANDDLRQAIEPVIQSWLKEKLGNRYRCGP